MQTKQIAVAIVAATAIVTVGACSNSESNTQSSSSLAVTSAPSSMNVAPADAQGHNDADVMFAQGMIPHHQQAVEMSDMLLAKEGIDPQVVSLAEKIKAAQAPEIETMRGWLSDWGVAPMPPMSSEMPSEGEMPGMPGHDMSGDGGMPGMSGMPGHGNMPGMSGQGMMSPADMTALQNAQGTEASRLFLTQMIKHHEGAISMSQNEIDNGENAAAIDMARNIASSQQDEIASMQQLLQSL
ncbi:DUF305 domain-containing protein [Mycolicibacterium sp. 120270]|uniref:DUF305 domain-containing protein n=1 Tax=Mycolicibacterium sp. 120270 TaxID=3090600 RepID=UPI00299E9230|nr:DUF305 domain-containing protein [Mycolicibacterium sp. 120270]MDX1884456.1 DUF305 domain-containing protein [Mycolicibacterium sp. 120270]